MPGAATGIYNSLFRWNWIYLSTIFVGAFGFEMAFNTTTDRIWDSMNKGRQWKDIKYKYVQKEDEDED